MAGPQMQTFIVSNMVAVSQYIYEHILHRKVIGNLHLTCWIHDVSLSPKREAVKKSFIWEKVLTGGVGWSQTFKEIYGIFDPLLLLHVSNFVQ